MKSNVQQLVHNQAPWISRYASHFVGYVEWGPVHFDPAVGHAEQGDGVQLFRDHGVDRISPQAGCGKVFKQNRIFRLNRARGDRVTKANVDLRFAACFGEFAGNHDAGTGVAGFLADVFGGDAVGIEGDPVFDRDGGDVAECLADGLKVARPKAEQVGVPCRPVRHVIPEREQQGAFEKKAVRVRRLAQAIQESLQRVADQNLVEVRSFGL